MIEDIINCEVGDYIQTVDKELHKVNEIRILQNFTIYLTGDSMNYKEWLHTGKIYNSSGGQSLIHKVIVKDKNPEYFL